MQVLLPEGWPRPKGYANGVKVRGTQVFIAKALHNLIVTVKPGNHQKLLEGLW